MADYQNDGNGQASKTGMLPPYVDLQKLSVSSAFRYTVAELDLRGELDGRDVAMARLGLELSERIDEDGLDSYASVYASLIDAICYLTRRSGSDRTELEWSKRDPADGGGR